MSCQWVKKFPELCGCYLLCKSAFRRTSFTKTITSYGMHIQSINPPLLLLSALVCQQLKSSATLLRLSISYWCDFGLAVKRLTFLSFFNHARRLSILYILSRRRDWQNPIQRAFLEVRTTDLICVDHIREERDEKRVILKRENGNQEVPRVLLLQGVQASVDVQNLQVVNQLRISLNNLLRIKSNIPKKAEEQCRFKKRYLQ